MKLLIEELWKEEKDYKNPGNMPKNNKESTKRKNTPL